MLAVWDFILLIQRASYRDTFIHRIASKLVFPSISGSSNDTLSFRRCVSTSVLAGYYIGCPTRYQTRHFFNNFTTNEDIATKFEADLPQCVRNVTS